MVHVLPNEEQTQIAEAVSRFLDQELPVERLRTGSNISRETARWREMAELGYLTLALPEALGGADLTLVEEVLVFLEFGRVLISPSAIATTIAAHMCAETGQAELAQSLAAGRKRAGLAIRAGDGALLLLDARSADAIVLRTADAVHLYEYAALTDVSAARGFDESVALDRATLAADPVLSIDNAHAPLERRLRILATAMLVAVAQAAQAMAVAYAKEREQFGRPIGSFQAIKHRCSDMAVASQMAYCQLLLATIAANSDAPDADFQVVAATVLAIKAALENSAASIQVHGGIGFTAEYDAHRFLKRARLLEQVCGALRHQQLSLLDHSRPEQR